MSTLKTLEIGKKYLLKRRGVQEQSGFIFIPETWVASDRLWWGESTTDEKVIFQWELPHFDIEEIGGKSKVSTCDCGGAKAKTTHAHWCSTNIVR